MAVEYEWDLELVDEHDDVFDHVFCDSAVEVVREFKNAQLHGEVASIVLVRTVWGLSGNEDRTWAYVKDGVLPEFTRDAYNRDAYKVPQKYHKEWRRANVSS